MCRHTWIYIGRLNQQHIRILHSLFSGYTLITHCAYACPSLKALAKNMSRTGVDPGASGYKSELSVWLASRAPN